MPPSSPPWSGRLRCPAPGCRAGLQTALLGPLLHRDQSRELGTEVPSEFKREHVDELGDPCFARPGWRHGQMLELGARFVRYCGPPSQGEVPVDWGHHRMITKSDHARKTLV